MMSAFGISAQAHELRSQTDHRPYLQHPGKSLEFCFYPRSKRTVEISQDCEATSYGIELVVARYSIEVGAGICQAADMSLKSVFQS